MRFISDRRRASIATRLDACRGIIVSSNNCKHHDGVFVEIKLDADARVYPISRQTLQTSTAFPAHIPRDHMEDLVGKIRRLGGDVERQVFET